VLITGCGSTKYIVFSSDSIDFHPMTLEWASISVVASEELHEKEMEKIKHSMRVANTLKKVCKSCATVRDNGVVIVHKAVVKNYKCTSGRCEEARLEIPLPLARPKCQCQVQVYRYRPLCLIRRLSCARTGGRLESLENITPKTCRTTLPTSSVSAKPITLSLRRR
jgi:ribosomal protein L36